MASYTGCTATMALYSRRERQFLQAVSQLAYSNPFLPERTELERAALGAHFVSGEPVWPRGAEYPERPRENVWRIYARLEPLMEQLQQRIGSGTAASEADLLLYEDAALHLLYQRYYPQFYEASFGATAAKPERWRFYQQFLADWR